MDIHSLLRDHKYVESALKRLKIILLIAMKTDQLDLLKSYGLLSLKEKGDFSSKFIESITTVENILLEPFPKDDCDQHLPK